MPRSTRQRHAAVVVAIAVLVLVGAGGCALINGDVPGWLTRSTSGPETSPVAMPAGAEGPFVVQRVVDGDTVMIVRPSGRVKVRVIGIDTPESVDPRQPVQCFGREATARAKTLLEGTSVFLQNDPSQDRVDRYGRELDYVWLQDGRLFNLVMIEEGFAHEYTYDVPYAFQPQFRAAQETAEDRRVGLWAPSTCSGGVTPAGR